MRLAIFALLLFFSTISLGSEGSTFKYHDLVGSSWRSAEPVYYAEHYEPNFRVEKYYGIMTFFKDKVINITEGPEEKIEIIPIEMVENTVTFEGEDSTLTINGDVLTITFDDGDIEKFNRVVRSNLASKAYLSNPNKIPPAPE